MLSAYGVIFSCSQINNTILPSNTAGFFDLSSLSAWSVDPSVTPVVDDALLVLLMTLLSFALR